GTDLDARGVLAEVAKLGYEEGMENVFLGYLGLGKTMHAAVGTIHHRFAAGLARARFWLGDNVTLDPGAEKGAFRKMVFLLARLRTKPAADAFVDVDGHPPGVFGGVVAFGRARADEPLLNGRFGGSRHRDRDQTSANRADLAEHTAPGDLVFHGTSFG